MAVSGCRIHVGGGYCFMKWVQDPMQDSQRLLCLSAEASSALAGSLLNCTSKPVWVPMANYIGHVCKPRQGCLIYQTLRVYYFWNFKNILYAINISNLFQYLTTILPTHAVWTTTVQSTSLAAIVRGLSVPAFVALDGTRLVITNVVSKRNCIFISKVLVCTHILLLTLSKTL